MKPSRLVPRVVVTMCAALAACGRMTGGDKATGGGTPTTIGAKLQRPNAPSDAAACKMVVTHGATYEHRFPRFSGFVGADMINTALEELAGRYACTGPEGRDVKSYLDARVLTASRYAFSVAYTGSNDCSQMPGPSHERGAVVFGRDGRHLDLAAQLIDGESFGRWVTGIANARSGKDCDPSDFRGDYYVTPHGINVLVFARTPFEDCVDELLVKRADLLPYLRKDAELRRILDDPTQDGIDICTPITK